MLDFGETLKRARFGHIFMGGTAGFFVIRCSEPVKEDPYVTTTTTTTTKDFNFDLTQSCPYFCRSYHAARPTGIIVFPTMCP